MTRYDDERAREMGHRYIHCRRCGYKGWSDDCGGCPNTRCNAIEEAERREQETEDTTNE